MKSHHHIANASFFMPIMSVCALCAAVAIAGSSHAEAVEADDVVAPRVAMSAYGTVDLAVEDTDLAQVLQMLSIQSKRNIIASPSISATVTANLYDVTFHEALDAILRVNGYGYIEEGNFIYVHTLAELEEIERASRRTESRIFELEYLSANDAKEFVEPLLSEDGRISARGEVAPGFRPDILDGGADQYAFTAKLVVNDYPENLDQVAQLLRDVDTPPQQVLVEATVLRTTLNEDNAFGIDFSIIGDIDFLNFSNPLSVVNELISGAGPDSVHVTEGANPGDPPTVTEIPFIKPDRATAVTSTVGNTAGPGGLKVGIVRDNVSVFLRVLDEVTDSKILARPKMLALNRQRAQVLVGERIPFRSSTTTQTSTTQSVEFLNTGIELAFRAFISRDGMIRMELQPKVSFAVREEIADGETAPREFTNELTTNVRMRDGETLVLGGLFQEEIQTTRRQVPVLGDVPGLGAAFRGHDDSVRRSEIVFLITPTIVHDEQLWDMGRDSLAYTEQVQIGARAGLLPFSRTRITSHYNQQAIKAYNEGDTRLAEWFLNNSLRMHALQPEMVRLRQQMTGLVDRPYERSILERVVRRELGVLHENETIPQVQASPAAPDHDSTPQPDFSMNPFAHFMMRWPAVQVEEDGDETAPDDTHITSVTGSMGHHSDE